MKITFSYDCEGNWGWPESDEGFFPSGFDRQLADSYRQLVSLHAEFDIPATLAFVGAYALPPARRTEILGEAVEAGLLPASYLDRSHGCWDGHSNFEIAAAVPQISIASHSMTHRQFSDLTPAERSWEMKASRAALTELSGVDVDGFVFPRNIVETEPAASETYSSVRDTPRGSSLNRLSELGRAVVGFGPEGDTVSDFIYWKGGARSRFSDTGWRRLWERRLAKPTQGTHFHVWAHPHNLTTDPSFLGRLRWLLERISDAQASVEFVDLGGRHAAA